MILLIGLGGVAGTLSRFYLGKWINAKAKSDFPWGTWCINLTGSLLLGILYALYQEQRIAEIVWQTAGTGFCGGFTTFSTFGYEFAQLVQKDKKTKAIVYAAASVLAGLLFAFLGMRLF